MIFKIFIFLQKLYFNFINHIFSCSKQEALELVEDIIRCLEFLYENLSKCFSNENNHSYLDHLFYIFFSRLFQDKSKIHKANSDNKQFSSELRQCDFHFLKPAAYAIYLPQEAQIQIDTALSEMEAMDYRDWVLTIFHFYQK